MKPINDLIEKKAFRLFAEGKGPREVSDSLAIFLDAAQGFFERWAECLRVTAKDERLNARVLLRSKLPLALAVLEEAASLKDAITKDEAASWNIRITSARTILSLASRHIEDDPIIWNTERPAERKLRGKLSYHSVVNESGAATLFTEFKPELDPIDKPIIVEAEVSFDATDLF
jgi:hypothetical protein